MADFNQAVQKIIAVEGGYQNHPDDEGNYNAYTADGEFVPYGSRKGRTLLVGTRWGISAQLYSAVVKRYVSVNEMETLSKLKAAELYRKYFWDVLRADEIDSQAVAEIVFDAMVNTGIWSVYMLQDVLNVMGHSLVVDGKLGPKTLAAINTTPAKQLCANYAEARREYYKGLNDQTFLKGWLARVDKFDCAKAQGGSGGALAALAAMAAFLYYKRATA